MLEGASSTAPYLSTRTIYPISPLNRAPNKVRTELQQNSMAHLNWVTTPGCDDRYAARLLGAGNKMKYWNGRGLVAAPEPEEISVRCAQPMGRRGALPARSGIKEEWGGRSEHRRY